MEQGCAIIFDFEEGSSIAILLNYISRLYVVEMQTFFLI